MRLIDAEILAFDIKVKRDWLDTSSVVGRGEYIALNKALVMIDEQPTIDAVEVIHGHWTNISISVSGHSSAECSVCGCVVHDSFSNVINYCPNCGAKMDREVKNDE